MLKRFATKSILKGTILSRDGRLLTEKKGKLPINSQLSLKEYITQIFRHTQIYRLINHIPKFQIRPQIYLFIKRVNAVK